MTNILKTTSFWLCSLAVLGSPMLEASTVYQVNQVTHYSLAESKLKSSTLGLLSDLRDSIEKLCCLMETSIMSPNLKSRTTLQLAKCFRLCSSAVLGSPMPEASDEEALSKLTHCYLVGLNLKSSALSGLSVLRNLQWLFLDENQIETLTDFPELKSLERLGLANNKLTSEALKSFPALPSLKKLDLEGNSGITDDDIIELASRFPKCGINGDSVTIHAIPEGTEYVRLGRRRVDLLNTESVPELKTANSLLIEDARLTSLAELEKLSLNNLHYLTIMNSGIKSLTAADAELLKSWAKFKSLHITDGAMTNVDVSCLSELAQLSSLDLSGNEELKTLTGLASLANLERLCLESTKIDSKELYEQLSSLSKLKKLYLNDTTIDTKLLGEKLAGLKGLKILRIIRCKTSEGMELDLKAVTGLSEALPEECEIVSDRGVYKNGIEQERRFIYLSRLRSRKKSGGTE